MGPLFSAALIAIIGMMVGAAVLGGALLVLRGWVALKFAVIVATSGAIGLVAGLLGGAALLPETLTGAQPILFLGGALTLSLASAGAAGFAFIRLRRQP